MLEANNFIEKETPAEVFCSEFCEMFGSTFSYRTPPGKCVCSYLTRRPMWEHLCICPWTHLLQHVFIYGVEWKTKGVLISTDGAAECVDDNKHLKTMVIRLITIAVLIRFLITVMWKCNYNKVCRAKAYLGSNPTSVMQLFAKRSIRNVWHGPTCTSAEDLEKTEKHYPNERVNDLKLTTFRLLLSL